MSASEQAKFLQDLAAALNNKQIDLPSFPDVVINIRTALEDPTCSAERLAKVARTDPVLVSRLLVSANAAFHNRAGIEIVDLGLAISRLGFETVRNTAITLAVEQIFNSSQHKDLRERLKGLWHSSINLSSMCYVLALRNGTLNSDNAFLCGLLNGMGKLYILTKARDYPALLGDRDSLDAVMHKWCPTVGKSIVGAWGFADEIADTMDAADAADSRTDTRPTLVDIVQSARLLIDDGAAALQQKPLHGSLARLKIDADAFADIEASYEVHVRSMRQSIA